MNFKERGGLCWSERETWGLQRASEPGGTGRIHTVKGGRQPALRAVETGSWQHTSFGFGMRLIESRSSNMGNLSRS